MPRIVFTAHLLRHVACPETVVNAGTVGAALREAFVQQPQVRDYVLDEQGRLRKHVVIFIDGHKLHDRLGLSDPVQSDSRIHVLQALTGG